MDPLPAPARQGPPPPRPPAPPTTSFGGEGLGDDDDRARARRSPGGRVAHPVAAVRASMGELRHVTWPRRAEVRSHATSVLIVLGLIVALLLAADALGAAVLAWMSR